MTYEVISIDPFDNRHAQFSWHSFKKLQAGSIQMLAILIGEDKGKEDWQGVLVLLAAYEAEVTGKGKDRKSLSR